MTGCCGVAVLRLRTAFRWRRKKILVPLRIPIRFAGSSNFVIICQTNYQESSCGCVSHAGARVSRLARQCSEKDPPRTHLPFLIPLTHSASLSRSAQPLPCPLFAHSQGATMRSAPPTLIAILKDWFPKHALSSLTPNTDPKQDAPATARPAVTPYPIVPHGGQ